MSKYQIIVPALAAFVVAGAAPAFAQELPNSKWGWGESYTETTQEPIGDVYTQGAAHSQSTFQDYLVTTTTVTPAINPGGNVVMDKSLVESSTSTIKVKVK